MKRRNFLKAICASPLALLAKKEFRTKITGWIKPKGGMKKCSGLEYPTWTTATSSNTTSKLIRCYYEPPENQTEYPFVCRDDGTIVANLEDYAIIPIETWKKMKSS